jgi:hypothetical protein
MMITPLNAFSVLSSPHAPAFSTQKTAPQAEYPPLALHSQRSSGRKKSAPFTLVNIIQEPGFQQQLTALTNHMLRVFPHLNPGAILHQSAHIPIVNATCLKSSRVIHPPNLSKRWNYHGHILNTTFPKPYHTRHVQERYSSAVLYKGVVFSRPPEDLFMLTEQQNLHIEILPERATPANTMPCAYLLRLFIEHVPCFYKNRRLDLHFNLSGNSSLPVLTVDHRTDIPLANGSYGLNHSLGNSFSSSLQIPHPLGRLIPSVIAQEFTHFYKDLKDPGNAPSFRAPLFIAKLPSPLIG